MPSACASPGTSSWSTLVAAVVYPVFGHWAWGEASLADADDGSDGWLRELGFVDFAGSTVVHSTGGWAALAAIIVIGPRIGRFGVGAVPIHGHDLPLTTLGVFVLWVGWYGFNGGSTFGADERRAGGHPEHDARRHLRRAGRHGVDVVA